ncbi:MAG: hypothetical protein MNPFHGCM_00945 [Gemmatimonadaceae bacterium]|nr:hypothetical protein [Gemmatimonadaceae bacterium]
MNLGRFLRGALAFTMLIVLQYSVRPLLGWRINADFLVIGVLLMAVRMRPGQAAILGFLTGLISDSPVPDAFGAGALAMTLIAFAASWLKAVFFADNVVLHAFFFLVGKWAFDIVYALAEHRLTVSEMVVQLLLWSPLAGAATALAGVLLLLLFRSALEPRTA